MIFEGLKSFNLDHSEHFSDTTRAALAEIEEIRPYIDNIEDNVFRRMQEPKWVSTGEMKNDVTSMRKKLDAFLSTVDRSSWFAGAMINDAAIESGKEEFIALRPKGRFDENLGMLDFLSKARVVNELLACAVDYFDPLPKGRMPNFQASGLASEVLKDFKWHEIKATTYQDGPYFRTLEIIFSELMPELGPQAYRRYGEEQLRK